MDINAGPVECWALAVHPLKQSVPHVATTGQSGHVNIWNYVEGTKVQTLEAAASNKFSMCVDYSHDGALLASGSMNGSVSVFDVASQKRVHSLEAHSMCVRAVCFSPDGKYFVSGSDDTQIHIYDVERGSAVSVLSGHGSWILSLRVSPNGKYIASGSSDRKLKIWSIQTGECVATLSGHSDAVWGVAWNNIGDRLVSVGDDDNIIVYKSLEK
jgi:WD repeat-containing protein 61